MREITLLWIRILILFLLVEWMSWLGTNSPPRAEPIGSSPVETIIDLQPKVTSQKMVAQVAPSSPEAKQPSTESTPPTPTPVQPSGAPTPKPTPPLQVQPSPAPSTPTPTPSPSVQPPSPRRRLVPQPPTSPTTQPPTSITQPPPAPTQPQPSPPTPGPAPAPAVTPPTTPATPPSPPVSPTPPRMGSGVVFNFDNADLYDVIRVMGEIMKISYIIDPKVKGIVNIHTSGQIPKANA